MASPTRLERVISPLGGEGIIHYATGTYMKESNCITISRWLHGGSTRMANG